MRTIAVASGKGGVGKTNIAANLAIALAQSEHKVLLFDADLGLSNLDVLLALNPQATLKQVVCEGLGIADAVVPGPEEIDVVTGGSGAKELVDLDDEALQSLWKKLEAFAGNYDFLVIDTASGIGRTVMTFLTRSDATLVVCTPDPTSVMDAYATSKTLFCERPGADVALIVNMADNERQGCVVYERYKAIVGQFLNREVALAGVILRDPDVLECTRARVPFIIASKGCHAAREVRRIAERLEQGRIEDDSDGPDLGLLQRLRGAFAVLRKCDKEEEDEEDQAA